MREEKPSCRRYNYDILPFQKLQFSYYRYIALYRYCRYYCEIIFFSGWTKFRLKHSPRYETRFLTSNHTIIIDWFFAFCTIDCKVNIGNNLIYSTAWHLISNLNGCRRRFRRVFIVISETYFEREKGGRTGYRLIQPSSKCAFIHSLYFRRTLKVITLNAET